MPIKSFKGLIANGEQDTITLHTNDGKTGYRIVKFELISNKPGIDNHESVVKIYKTEQTTVDAVIDFSDNTLLASGYLEGSSSVLYVDALIVTFDNEIFNQDIYITHSDALAGSISCNYYIELEQISLDLNEQTVTTLKDLRNND